MVLEPDEPLSSARLAFYAGMVALCDALAALAPPEKPIAIEWPDAIRIDGVSLAAADGTWPDATDERAVPDWLVFGATIRTVSMSGAEAGLDPSRRRSKRRVSAKPAQTASWRALLDI